MFVVSECERYLQRIGYRGGVTPHLGNLGALMGAHLTHIPFETVGLHRSGRVPDLELDALYDKVVGRRRGGYCFELNKLFQELLATLGYDARAAVARSTDTPGQVDPLNHRGLIVRLDGVDYSADVGYGGPMPAGPLPLVEGEHVVEGRTFLVEGPRDGWWVVDRIDSAGRRSGLLELSTFRVNEQDFDPLNLYCASPGSVFRDVEMANILTEEGHVSWEDGPLTVRRNGEKTVTTLEGDEAASALKRYFGLAYPRP